METAFNNLIPLSCKGKWDMAYFEKNYDEQSLKRKFLKTIPYAIFDKIVYKLQYKWNEYLPKIKEVINKYQKIDISSPSSLMKQLCLDNMQVRIENVLEIANKINDPSINKCLIPTEKRANKSLELELERHTCNQDLSKGFLSDLSTETLSGLAACIEKYYGWLRMTDGLGFDLQTGLNFVSPEMLLKKWLEFNPNATLSRLHYEAESLQFTRVCEYIEAIPLIGVAKKNFFPIEFHPFERNFNQYDMTRLNEIFARDELEEIDWSTKNFYNGFGCDPYPFWISRSYSLNEMLRELEWIAKPEIKKGVQSFRVEIEDGRFEPISSGGISYSQMQYLSKSIDGSLNFLSLKNKCKLFNELGCSIYTETENNKVNGLMALTAYWQLKDEMNLSAFYASVFKILCKYSIKMANDFQERYLTIQPYRSYDPVLAEKNLNRTTKGAPKESYHSINAVIRQEEIIHEIGKKIGTCTICHERPINAAALPCAHFTFCLECIEQFT